MANNHVSTPNAGDAGKETFARNVFFSARRALSHHTSGGNVLMLATLFALIAANTPVVSSIYNDFWSQEIRLQIGDFNLFSHAGHPMTVLQFINDALMAIFFFNIGLEIKREILVGELSSVRQALLPILGAIGGMIVPVGIFFIMSRGTSYTGGAAIPMATDIAFSLGIIALLGSRVPSSLKIFLTTLAVVDDIGGIIVIAAFYSGHIDLTFIGYAAIGLLVLLAGGAVLKIQTKMFYFIIGGVVWFLVLNSGIHPTIAGVLVALCVPSVPVFAPDKYIRVIRENIRKFREDDDLDLNSRTILSHEQMDWLKEIETASDRVISPLQDMEDQLHPLTDYLIIPLFAFANAGIFLLDIEPMTVVSGISIAIIVSLVIGKFTGILLFSWLGVKTGIAPMPEKANWKMMSAISLLGGIGFTVSLFIASLTFDSSSPSEAAMLDNAKLGIVAGSLIAGVLGYVLLYMTLPAKQKAK
ncbi:Na+/H+ antiporter NhaA [uncultured Duncaniella sp.]|uniref:Na+/H+ antiporter NhaA n=1 Tax=uncultured Duncaniella sp. TaxID=2768039 RepID=UPI0025F429B8|nr:Na+/H+ antiporter NhaA [uncultured Duncaniella sp.]